MAGACGARIGIAAFLLGLSLAGPGAVGVAAADSAEEGTSPVSAGPRASGAPQSKVTAPTRAVRSGKPGSGRGADAAPARGAGVVSRQPGATAVTVATPNQRSGTDGTADSSTVGLTLPTIPATPAASPSAAVAVTAPPSALPADLAVIPKPSAASDSDAVAPVIRPVMTAAPAAIPLPGAVSGSVGLPASPRADSGSDAPAAAALAWAALAVSRREVATGSQPAASAAAATTSGEPPAGSVVGTPIANPLQDFIRIFIGDGTAANPNAGVLIGTGYSWTAQTCNQGAACNGGQAGVLWGSGGSGFNGGNGGSAGLLGSGGAGGAGIAEVNGGAGGAGGRGGLLWGNAGRDGANWIAPVFTTSNQLPTGGTILALPIESMEIGVLRSFLQSVPGVSQSYINASKGGLDFTLDVLEVPEGTSFYKALKIPPSGLFPQDDVLNTFAVSTNWYSSLEVAQAYADSPWGQSQGYQVVAFDAPKPLKLIDLGDDDTLGYVWAGLESDIRWTEAQLARLQGEDPPTTNPEAIVVVSQQLDELRQDMAIVQLTTGFNASYATQLELLRQYGDAITNDFSYNPATEIENRGIAPGDTFIVEVAEIANTWQPATLVTGFATDPGGAVTWGATVDDLNRISFTTAIDKELTSIIGTYLNVDGYYAGELPSLFHRDGRLIEEIALFIPRDSTAIAGTQSTLALGGQDQLRVLVAA